ncbi:MAG: mechanosensitive ion channel [Bacteroidota bacterium]|nr:mechanosensitive ion channel [Bacteroidota bacterium]
MPAFLDKHIDRFMDTAAEYAPKVLMAIVVLTIGLWVIKRIAILADKAMKKKDLEVSLRTFLKSLMSIGLKVVLIVTVAGMMGIGTASFVTVLGAAGLAVGLALQGSLSNFAGGVLILIFKPFKVGDTIEAQGQTGEVKEIQIFNTFLLTGDHKTVILPNGVLSNNTIVNNTRAGNLRIDIQLSVSTDNNIAKVKEIIMEVIDKNDKILKEPLPGIFVGKIADGAIAINVKPFCIPDDTSQLASDLYNEIKVAFEKNIIKPPIPKR